MHYLTVPEVIQLYRLVMERSGGTVGILSIAVLESAVAQPRVTFAGNELYPTIVKKAATLGFSLVMNHAFIDGNKRIGHAAMETFLSLDGFEINASANEQEMIILQLAKGEFNREDFTNWLKTHITKIGLHK